MRPHLLVRHLAGAAAFSSLALACATTTPAPAPPATTAKGTRHDFRDAVIAEGADAADARLFAKLPTTATPGGPGVLEPVTGSVWPKNWAPPTFAWSAGADANGNEPDRWLLLVQVPGQAEPLRVITAQRSWTPSQALWDQVRQNVGAGDDALKLTIYAASHAALEEGNPSPFSKLQQTAVRLAPFELGGSVIYWTPTNNNLQSLRIGASKPVEVYGEEKAGSCVGCHTSAPDGTLGVTVNVDGWGVRLVSPAGEPLPETFLSKKLRDTIGEGPRGVPAFSAAYWKQGDHRVLYGLEGRLAVASLEKGTEQKLPIEGGDEYAVMATWSPDGQKVVFTSAKDESDNRTNTGPTQLWQVPFNDGKGGKATPVKGASDPKLHQYYPAFSPDGRFLAFTRSVLEADGSAVDSYNNALAEIYVIPAEGGTPVRLAANDPAPDSQKKSPGVTNSWPKWAPRVVQSGGSSWYFLTFSSTRGEAGRPQIYIAPLEVTGTGEVKSHPAYLLPGQDPETSNHTPAWVE